MSTAVDLYRGDFLEGFYDDWCIEERYRLEALYLGALTRLIAWREAQRDFTSVLAYARKHLAYDPLQENMRLAAMRALVALGDLPGTRRQWQLCCQARQQELDTLPSPEILAQAESLLGAQFAIPLAIEPVSTRAPL